MQPDRIILRMGDTSLTVFDLLLIGSGLGLLILATTLVLAWRLHRQRGREALEAARRSTEMEFRLAELTGSLRSFADQAQGAQAQLSRSLGERLDQVSHRVGTGLSTQAERTAEQLSRLHQRLAVIDAAQQNLTSLSSEMISLKDILSNKQARGAYGQGRMEAIIKDGLHARAYSFQATLSNKMRPDCLITLPESKLGLVVDAKFPLEAFNLLRAAKADTDARAAETQLRADVLRHVKAIAERYLIPGETHETAIMFVPAESIYADLHEKFEDVVQKAHRARVIIASPNVLMLLVQTMQAIVRDSAMREQSQLIKIEVIKMLEDVSRLKDRIGDLQRHFGQANEDLEKLGVSAGKIASRGLKIESLELDQAPPEATRPRLVVTRE
jgi:DNA recombination protein RmuC